jgi:glycosyltransferase involved in cell wall biosynthesis
MKTKLVSVVIPSFNRVGVVCETVDSVLKQTYPAVEAIIADDGSSDGTAEVIRARYGGNERVRYFAQPNGGAASARNLGLKNARGEYVAFLDSDDVWFPGKLEAQIASLESIPDAGLIWSDFETIDGSGRRLHERRLRSMYEGYRFFPDLEKLFDGYAERPGGAKVYWSDDFFSPMALGNLIHNSTVVMTRQRREQTGFLTHLKIGEDHDYFMRACKLGKVAFLDEVTMSYRIGEGDAISADKNLYAVAEAFIWILERSFREDSKRIHLPRRLVRTCFSDAYLWAGRERLKKGDLRQAREHLLTSLRHRPRLSTIRYLAAAHLGPRARNRVRQIWRAARRWNSVEVGAPRE